LISEFQSQKDWEFFYTDVDQSRSKAVSRGFQDVDNRLGLKCFECHKQAGPGTRSSSSRKAPPLRNGVDRNRAMSMTPRTARRHALMPTATVDGTLRAALDKTEDVG